MEIRRGRRKDIKRIIELAAAGGLYRYPYFLYFILILCNWVRVVEEQGAVIGYYSYVLIPYIPFSFLLQMSLDSTRQQQGLGTKLLNGVLDYLRDEGVKLVKAHTLKPHVSQWLVKKGFTEIISCSGVRVLKKYL